MGRNANSMLATSRCEASATGTPIAIPTVTNRKLCNRFVNRYA